MEKEIFLTKSECEELASKLFISNLQIDSFDPKCKEILSEEILKFLREICRRRNISKDNCFPFLRNLFPLYEISKNLISMKKTKFQLSAFIIGISGLQGTGKTFTSELLSQCLNIIEPNLKISVSSIDDFYLSYDQLSELKENCELYSFRGPPGTHEINLLSSIFQTLKSQNHPQTIFLPKYDKGAKNGLGDSLPEVEVPFPDIYILEGWFLNYFSLPTLPSEYSNPLSEFINIQLKEYENIWNQLDYTISLIPQSYTFSLQWRTQAEEMMKTLNNNKGMSKAQINEFVNYFWKSLPPQLHLPLLASISNLSFQIDIERAFYSSQLPN